MRNPFSDRLSSSTFRRPLILGAIILGFAALEISCTPSSRRKDSLREGDLIFQANEGSDFVSAIEAVTSSKDPGMSFSHVGIVHYREGIKAPYVIEATPSYGVVATPLSEFLDSSAHSSVDGCPLVRVKRYPDARIARKAAQRSLKFLGKEYDFLFSPGQETLYCTELVYYCFRTDDGKPLLNTNPMTFKDSTGKTSPLWEEYYARREAPIPEGVPGTNPNDMFGEEVFMDVDITPSQLERLANDK